MRSSSAILHQIDPSLEEASISLGVSPLRTFLGLIVPLMLGGIVSGMVLTWVTVASELSSTVVLYSGPWRTLTIVMFQALEGTGAGVAVAAASVLIAITLIPSCWRTGCFGAMSFRCSDFAVRGLEPPQPEHWRATTHSTRAQRLKRRRTVEQAWRTDAAAARWRKAAKRMPR